MTPLIVGLAGPTLAEDERAMLRALDPVGVILFARNVVDPGQLRALTDDLRTATARADLPILIDQEGGMVARLAPPHWPALHPAPAFGALWDRAPMTAIQAARAQGEAIGHILAAAGITMNAAPVLDLAIAGAHPAIAGRAFAGDPLAVAALGRATIEGMARGGVVAVMKHLPGHGRATVDPHRTLPIVDASAQVLDADLAPYRRLSGHVAAMVGHVVYPAWDAARPASLSATVIGAVIRGTIGFGGMLLSDDLHMDALSGALAERAAAALTAGCDVALCCHATPTELLAMAETLPPLTVAAAARVTRATAPLQPCGNRDEAIARRDTLLATGEGADRLALPAGNA